MKFSFFHLMPWTDITDSGKDWPVANKHFEPERGTEFYRNYIDAMAYAEECGFDLVGCNEHHFSPYGLMANPNLIAAALAQRTNRIQLAVFGNLVPLNNPIRVAEEYAMLDVMSGGRLVAGFMRGIPHEYVAYNIDPNESWARLHEATELILKAWTEPEPFGWEGEYYQFRSVSIWPRPRQQPHPPIMMSASNPESAEFAAKHRAMMGVVMLVNLDGAKQSIRIYKDAARANGWEPAPQDILIGQHTCVCETDEEARHYLSEGRKYFYGVLGGGVRTAANLVLKESRFYENAERRQGVDKRRQVFSETTIDEFIEQGAVLCGSPETVVKQIKRIHRELGNGMFNITMKVGNIPDSVVWRGMQLFKERVLPEVHDL
ncbi:MAG: LLM class flavin-dependent oxidoreductase [Rhizobiales bacterium]|nr:LLM class flavin-dependent oxidoreductase [Hyphomicrobiales bacterium]